jgi:phosphatidylglycerol:prolipoprotein diacylglycerol transferase
LVNPIVVIHGPRRIGYWPNRGGLRQVLFEWRGIRIYSFPAMLYLGLALGTIVGNLVANLAGMDTARVLIATVLLIIPGLIGARLLFVAIHWEIYCREPRRIFRRSEGGAVNQGGLVLAVSISPPILTALQLPFGAFWDAATFGMLIWLIVGRFGCVLHGCCSGRPSTGFLALHLPDHRGIWCRRIPAQFLEAGWAALVLVGVAGLWNKQLVPGALFFCAVAAYGIGRIALQPTRDSQDRFGALNVHQALSLALSALSLMVLLALWLSQNGNL